jgi:hypothetical protein
MALLKEFEKQIAELKSKLYTVIVRYDEKDRPGSLEAMHEYESLLKKIFLYWRSLFYGGKHMAYVLRMPSKELQEMFNMMTHWYVKHIINNSSFYNDALSILKTNYEKGLYQLS